MRIAKKFVRLGTGSDEISATDLSANFPSPSNYTPDSADIKGHLSGLDSALTGISVPAGDLGHASFSIADNQVSAANVTGLAFANASTRGAKISYTVTVDATSDLFEVGEIELVQRGADWTIAREFSGDDSLVDFTVTTLGQVQYTSPAFSGFVSATMKFRAITLEV